MRPGLVRAPVAWDHAEAFRRQESNRHSGKIWLDI
jgi:hypothetical protein